MLPEKTLIQKFLEHYDFSRVTLIVNQFERAWDSAGVGTTMAQMGGEPLSNRMCVVGILDEPRMTIGRIGLGSHIIGRNWHVCAIPLQHAAVSREHALVTVHNDRVMLRDLSSRNGTFVDGVRLGKDEASRVENKIIRICGIYLGFQFRELSP